MRLYRVNTKPYKGNESYYLHMPGLFVLRSGCMCAVHVQFFVVVFTHSPLILTTWKGVPACNAFHKTKKYRLLGHVVGWGAHIFSRHSYVVYNIPTGQPYVYTRTHSLIYQTVRPTGTLHTFPVLRTILYNVQSQNKQCITRRVSTVQCSTGVLTILSRHV